MSIFKKIANLFKKAETEVHKFVLEISDFAFLTTSVIRLLIYYRKQFISYAIPYYVYPRIG